MQRQRVRRVVVSNTNVARIESAKYRHQDLSQRHLENSQGLVQLGQRGEFAVRLGAAVFRLLRGVDPVWTADTDTFQSRRAGTLEVFPRVVSDIHGFARQYAQAFDSHQVRLRGRFPEGSSKLVAEDDRLEHCGQPK